MRCFKKKRAVFILENLRGSFWIEVEFSLFESEESFGIAGAVVQVDNSVVDQNQIDNMKILCWPKSNNLTPEQELQIGLEVLTSALNNIDIYEGHLMRLPNIDFVA